MVAQGFTRWALTIVVIVLILTLIAAATVIMASAILRPPVVPAIKVQPEAVKPGDVVVVTGKGWPGLENLVIVLALSPTRDLATPGLVPVGAVPVGLDGTLTASFVFPTEVPWTAVREAWLVARPPAGNLQAVAHLTVQRLKPTPTPTICPATTPLGGQQQVQGVVLQLLAEQGVLIVRPFDGGTSRAVVMRAARLRFADGRAAALEHLRVGVNIVAVGWLDASSALVAEQITILEVIGTTQLGALQLAPACTPTAAICLLPVATSTPVPVYCAPVAPVYLPAPTACLPVAPSCTPLPVCPSIAPGGTPTRYPCPALTPACTPTRFAIPTIYPTAVPSDFFAGQFFPNPWLSGPPVAEQVVRVIDYNWYNWPLVLPDYGYSARWTGTWYLARTSTYRFLLLVAGGGRLTVDGRLVINAWDNPPPAEYAGEIGLAQGLHNLVVEYRNLGQRGRIQLRWELAPGPV